MAYADLTDTTIEARSKTCSDRRNKNRCERVIARMAALHTVNEIVIVASYCDARSPSSRRIGAVISGRCRTHIRSTSQFPLLRHRAHLLCFVHAFLELHATK